MSVVYPAPSLLPTVDSANATTSYFAPASGGGGGGGGGPNPVVSSILFNPNQEFISGNVSTIVGGWSSIVQTQSVPDPANWGSLAIGALLIAGSTTEPGTENAAVLTADIATNVYLESRNLYVSSIICSTINGAVPGGGGGAVGPILNNISTINMNPGSAAIDITSAGPSILSITNSNTPSQNDIRFFTNESANAFVNSFQPGGQANLIQVSAPGGGTYTTLNFGATDAGAGLLAVSVPSNGNPSTLTIATDNLVLTQPAAAGATLNITASDTKLYDISVPSVARMSIGLVGGRNQVYMDTAEADDLMVSSITAVAGANVQVLKPMAVSSIVGVSTINGAAYPPAAPIGITRTTLATNNGAAIVADAGGGGGAGVVISPDFTPTAGHLYQLVGNIFAIPSPNASSNAALRFYIGNNDQAAMNAFPVSGYAVGPYGNNPYVNITWRSGASAPDRLYGEMYDPAGSAVSTFLNSSATLNLIDYGPVA